MTPAQTVIDPLQAIGISIIAFIPALISAIILLIIGIIIGALIGKVVSVLLEKININSFFERLGLSKAAGKFDWAGFVGWLVEWFIIFIFLISVFDTLGLPQISQFIRDIAAYIPNIIVAVLIFIFGAIIADALSKIVKQATKTSKILPADVLATAVKWTVIIFTLFAALIQLRIAPSIIQILFAGIVATLVIVLGLSFGLGGREAAQRWIDKLSSGSVKK